MVWNLGLVMTEVGLRRAFYSAPMLQVEVLVNGRVRKILGKIKPSRAKSPKTEGYKQRSLHF